MSQDPGVSDRLDRTLDTLQRTTYATFLGLAIVFLVCATVLIILGTFGVLHPGDDFAPNGPGRSGGGGDIIVLPRLVG